MGDGVEHSVCFYKILTFLLLICERATGIIAKKATPELLELNQDEYPNFIYTGIVLLKSTKMNTLISYILE